MHTRFCFFVAFLSGLVVYQHSASAQTMIGGMPVSCNDFRGFPVYVVANPMLNDVGMATLGPNGQPIMVLNPGVLQSQPPVLQLFWYAHECAHHVLGHIVNRSQLNEAQADCWAVRTGRQQGWFPPQAFQLLIQVLGNSPGSPWGHLPGPAQIQNMLSCYQS